MATSPERSVRPPLLLAIVLSALHEVGVVLLIEERIVQPRGTVISTQPFHDREAGRLACTEAAEQPAGRQWIHGDGGVTGLRVADMWEREI